MSVNLSAPDPKTIFPVAGVELGTACAGIRKAGRRDVMVMRFCKGAKAAGVFTQNRFAAAPVRVCRMLSVFMEKEPPYTLPRYLTHTEIA